MAHIIRRSLKTYSGTVFRHWPQWEWKKSEIENLKLFTELSAAIKGGFSKKSDVLLWADHHFQEHFKKQIERQKSIKKLYGWSVFPIFLCGVSLLSFVPSYLGSRSGWFLLPFAISVLWLAKIGIKIRDLRRRKVEPNLLEFCSNNKKLHQFILNIKAKRLRLFFEDDHGDYFEITEKIWTAQNWFLLFSLNAEHLAGISMTGIPPYGRVLILKSDIEEYLSPHSRKCPYARAALNNYDLLEAFINAAETSTYLTETRKSWLEAAKIIYRNWVDWQVYTSGDLKNPAKKNLETDLIEALTGSREYSTVNVDVLSDFTNFNIRPFNTWIKNMKVVTSEDLKKVS